MRFFRRTPLRVKLVGTVIALSTIALVAIGAASSIALRRYLIGRIDDQIVTTSRRLDPRTIPQAPVNTFIPPTTWIVTIKDDNGNGYVFPNLPAGQQPMWPIGVKKVQQVQGKPYTVRSMDSDAQWRLLVTPLDNGLLFIVGQSLNDVNGAVKELIFIELVIGAATLVVVTAVGVGVVRANLRPLVQIEETSLAIADGDLTQRVPEFEPGEDPPRTEVGHLGRALNVMLTEIESAFQAREASEAAAQDAATAAQASEARARSSEERMRRFAADASHELRTPLTTIRGFAELYRQGAAREPEDTDRLMRRIEDEASRMGLLVEDMLLLARLDQERPLDVEPVDLRVIASDAVVNAKAIAPSRPIDLQLAPNAGPLIVRGDELRLRQVFTNLMANALTYTPPDSPIALRLGRSERPGYAELAVIDHGPGLSDDQAARVFERFYRGDAARTRQAANQGSSGTGLGLAIVAALVAAHRGTVSALSTPGHGATFVVSLPLSSDTTSDDLTDMSDMSV
jgi:two-component system, OmpR family, sensor kinase